MAAKELVGRVISDVRDKTVTVVVERMFLHPKYKKRIRRSKKYHAHDEYNKCRIGDKVRIRQTRPISKTKRWEVIEIYRERTPPTDLEI